MDMLSIRNDLFHDYDGEIVAEHCETIVSRYIDLMLAFQNKVEELLKS
jgi:hypothetical protein